MTAGAGVSEEDDGGEGREGMRGQEVGRYWRLVGGGG